ncbi:PucR family transcriptional regulator [Streptomonospora nanhaiensis]|uniref:PucR family transcriptional regulator n=1 Tax=Streptomonospora nanhaiensis TaxID=1323731 RepID=UPI001C38EDCC|nr:helix-turn-helix domain-containing protein [Streptomonospora nanhaiensis]MBV2364201.1 helix-turn-helix domain-containing protein [Streptomonospora nanhaiensis]MBX9386679.1 helix-turn-helix domain-containing protein [Streptomonospora nanhaiensis]
MIRLERLLAILGGYGARSVGARPRPGALVRGVAVHDATRPEPDQGDIFLAVGVPDAAEALDLALRAGAETAVVRGAADERCPAAHRARERGTVLLAVDPAVSWSQVAGIVFGLVLEGGETESGRGPADLPSLADTIAARVGAPVTIEDRRFRVLAHSDGQESADRARLETILGRRVPPDVQRHLEDAGVVARLAASVEPVFVPPSAEHGLRGRTAIAVRAGRETLGSLWAMAERPLDAERSALLKEGAHTVALHLLRTRVSADLERQVESDLVTRLLEGGIDPTESASRLGLISESHRVIALQAHTPGERHAAALMAFERATTGFGWSRAARSTIFGSTVYTLLPCGGDPAPAREWLRATCAGLPDHVLVHAGIGGPADLPRLPDSRREADESLNLHSTLGAGAPAVAYDESWDAVLLHRLRLASTSGRRPAEGPAAELARHDAERGTRYVPTLRAWLRAQGDPNEAARALGVHPNTVRHRMRRMAELADLRLADHGARFALAIALETLPEADAQG